MNNGLKVPRPFAPKATTWHRFFCTVLTESRQCDLGHLRSGMKAKMWTQRKKTEKATNKTEGPRNRSMEEIQGPVISLEKRSQKVSSLHHLHCYQELVYLGALCMLGRLQAMSRADTTEGRLMRLKHRKHKWWWPLSAQRISSYALKIRNVQMHGRRPWQMFSRQRRLLDTEKGEIIIHLFHVQSKGVFLHPASWHTRRFS